MSLDLSTYSHFSHSERRHAFKMYVEQSFWKQKEQLSCAVHRNYMDWVVCEWPNKQARCLLEWLHIMLVAQITLLKIKEKNN